jgi:hypothetical protein
VQPRHLTTTPTTISSPPLPYCSNYVMYRALVMCSFRLLYPHQAIVPAVAKWLRIMPSERHARDGGAIMAAARGGGHQAAPLAFSMLRTDSAAVLLAAATNRRRPELLSCTQHTPLHTPTRAHRPPAKASPSDRLLTRGAALLPLLGPRVQGPRRRAISCWRCRPATAATAATSESRWVLRGGRGGGRVHGG